MVLFAHIPFLPYLDDPTRIPSREILIQLQTIVPILISAVHAAEILALLPAQVETYIYDDLDPVDLPEADRLETLIILLDRGSSKVISQASLVKPLLERGVPHNRIIPRFSSSSSPQNLDHLSDLSSSSSGNPQSVMLEIPHNSDSDLSTSTTTLEKFLDFIDHQSKDHPTFLLDPHRKLESLLSSSSSSKRTMEELNVVQIIGTTDLIKMDSEQLIEQFLKSLKTDRPDGLYTTSVVSDSPACSLLGQVYSSLESIKKSIQTRKATYYSRSRSQLWIKGESSGATQECLRIRTDCDRDSLEFHVIQKPLTGFCHTQEISCFGPLGGLKQLESTLLHRLQTSTPGSYTNRLFNDEKLLRAKIMEEAEELCDAESPSDLTGEMADLLYFALCRCISKGVSLAQVEQKLNQRALKVTRRKGDAKPKWEAKIKGGAKEDQRANPAPKPTPAEGPLRCQMIDLKEVPEQERASLLKRPMTDSRTMTGLVTPIIEMVKTRGDQGLLEAVQKFDRCGFESADQLTIRAPFAESSMQISPEIKQAIDVAYNNIYKFHEKQLEKERTPMVVETMKGVVCSRFVRPIDRVGLYVPGGTAILPSTALMLAIPAQVAGCEAISIATPARADGTISAEIMYIAQKCGVQEIVKAGGAHAIAALAYGTQRVSKVDKIFGPGNQFVTVAKMLVASDVHAATAIDMPAGPSEVLLIADRSCDPVFVAADLLSQAEHGIDSQVILLAIDLKAEQLQEIQNQINLQAHRLSRIEIIKQSIPKSFIVQVPTLDAAFQLSNHYAPEHLILHIKDPNQASHLIRNAGSVFIGPFSPESCGDYASGTNHSLPTVGFAKQYSGVSTMSFMKHITTQELTKDGLKELGPTVIRLANLEGLDGHANAVQVRLLQ
ncbi:trifunctional histidinol dehydrogenase [Puccinia graminis f. sp. tritici]|uniref:Histidine biosynthesis trifunctional protein n=1 Tax=Puccinia graminis f. sp. tritici TaxID=56615 RepID=A0A5B0M4X0_PUCGR|nr:trifunctional histidinol dehydrogenase [Puccinia graminis f. sp. tritici]KAA1094320.1 trifunctional histidinol dehydrogenase [Puccinia graminis f. sp. tritici]